MKTFEKPNVEQIAWVLDHVKDYLDEGGDFSNLAVKLDLSEGEYNYLLINSGFIISLFANDYVLLNEKIFQLMEYLKKKEDVPYKELKKIISF